MDKRHIIVSIIVAGLMAFVLCGIKASEKPQVINEGFSGESDMAWVADPFDSIYAQAIVPQLLDCILTDGDWWERRYYSSLSLRAKYSNGRFVTYQMATNENRNGPMVIIRSRWFLMTPSIAVRLTGTTSSSLAALGKS